MSEANAGFGGGDAGGDWPKASIGNYKGVMLCNRPNEFGQQKRPERTGLEPFINRVDPKVPLGWNPAAKLLPRQTKKKVDPNSILVRHKKFLKQLERQKNVEREDAFNAAADKENKTKAFKAQAQRQREKIKGLKGADNMQQNDEQALQEELAAMENDEKALQEELARMEVQNPPAAASKPKPLTAANLDAASRKSAASGKAKKGKKGAAASKPAWAMTEQQLEENKEAEIDELLEFAYELDYEKYMEDYEVRQALAIIKDRVNEITQQPNWKEQITEEWNQANAEEDAARQERRAADPDARSTVTYQSHVSKASKASYASRVSEAKRKEAAERPEWNGSIASSKPRPSAEDRIASKIAAEVLRDNAKLRGIHSNNSLKVMLEREAKKQMLAAANGGQYTGPVIAVTQEKGKRKADDPSNLPYLHKNPAV